MSDLPIIHPPLPRPDLGVPTGDELLYLFLAEHEPARSVSPGGLVIGFRDTGWLPDGCEVDGFGMVSGGWPTDSELAAARARVEWVHQ